MTQKNMIIGGVIVVVLAAVGIAFYLQNSATATPSANVTPDVTTTPSASSGAAVTGTGTGTLGSILSKGGNYTCSVSTTEGSAQTNVVVYVSGSKTRMELRGKTATGPSPSLIIVRTGSFAYTWVEGMTTGTKVALGPKTPLVPQASGGGYTIDENSTAAWDCHPWLPDQTMLVAPSSITFSAQ